ncbi:MAG: Ig domain-containing protein [Acidimicrobiales bacterium]
MDLKGGRALGGSHRIAALVATVLLGAVLVNSPFGVIGRTAPAASATAAPILGLLGATVPNFAEEHAAGIQSVTIGAVWSLAQSSSSGTFSSTYAGQIRAEIASAHSAGLSVVLDPGLQYPPSWAFFLNSQTRFVNQYGDVYSAGGSSGNNAINAVTDAAVRSAEGTYLSWLGTVISPGSVIAVRQGGGPLGELHYPLASYNHHPDSYWAYDAASQATLPASVQNWSPGTGTVAQATTFLNAYNQNLNGYSIWLNGQLHNDFGVKELVMLPGWGERPNLTPTSGPFYTVETDLLVPPNQTYPEFNEGLDWTDILASLPDAADSVAYTTYLDAPTNPPGLPASVQLEDPADYLASLVRGTPIRLGGENSLSDQTVAAMTLCLSRAQALGFFIVNWMGEEQLLATAAGTAPGDPTLGQLVRAYATATGTGGSTLSIATSSVPGAVKGHPYRATLSATAGDPSYSWSVSTGALPAGLGLNPSTGVVSGIPVTSGRSVFTVQVTDQSGTGVRADLAITVSAGPGPGTLAQPVVGLASTPDGGGYWVVDAAGSVMSFGDATFFGSTVGLPLNLPINHIVATPDGGGYWLVAADGGIFTFGDAGFFGSMGGIHLNAPVVDLAPTPTGRGYWLVAADGGIFTFGDAGFFGSMGGRPLNRPVVGLSPDPSTGGYWLVASDGGIFAFAAPFLGSTGAIRLNRPINGMTASPDGEGYWFVGSDGGVFAFGDARFAGSTGGIRLNQPVVGMAADAMTGGYWLVAADGGVFAFGAPFLGAA